MVRQGLIEEIAKDTVRIYKKFPAHYQQATISATAKAKVFGIILDWATKAGADLTWTRAELQLALARQLPKKSPTALRARIDRALASLKDDGMVRQVEVGSRGTIVWGLGTDIGRDLSALFGS